ncbi:hypothetical protein NKH28_26775 [Mesorhizobium sp. M1227]|uniref:hypothetical protein n=1 Tax=Mesorhizobium sp. M1227 TaxID=2957071 RepID=UPI0033367811
MNLKGLWKTDESGFAQVSALTPRTRRTVGTILHMAADAKIPLSAVVAQHRVPSRSIQPARKLSGRSCAMLAHLKASEGAVSHLLVGPDAMMATTDVDGLRLTFDGWGVLHIRPSLKRAQMTCYVEAVKNWT